MPGLRKCSNETIPCSRSDRPEVRSANASTCLFSAGSVPFASRTRSRVASASASLRQKKPRNYAGLLLLSDFLGLRRKPYWLGD